MAEGTNVGSVSLGVEIDANFSTQLNKMTDKIASQLSNAFKKVAKGNFLGKKVSKDLEQSMTALSESIKYQMDMVGINLEQSMSRVDFMLEKTTSTVDKTLNSMVEGINTAIDKILEKLKSLESSAQNTTSKMSNTSIGAVSVPTPRGPPIKATKEDLLIQKDMLNDQSNQIDEQVNMLRNKLNQITEEYSKIEARASKSIFAQKSMLKELSSQIEAQIADLNHRYDSLTNEFDSKSIGMKGSTRDKKVAEIDKTFYSIQKLENKLSSINSKFEELDRKEVDFKDKNAKKAEQEVVKLKSAIHKLENKLGDIGYKSEVLDRQILKIEQDSTTSANKQVSNNTKISTSIDKLRTKIASLGNTLRTVNNSPLSKPLKGMAKMTAYPFKKVTGGFKKIGKSAYDTGQLGSRGMNVLDKSFWKVFKKILILGVMTKALKGFMGYIGGTLMANENFRNSLATTKLNLAAAFQPIIDIIIPALVNLMDVLAKVTGYMAAFVATMFGTTYKASVEGVRKLKEQTDAYKELGKSSKSASSKVDKAVKKMKGSLAGFDEVNTLTIKDDTVENKEDLNNGSGGWQNAAMTEIGDTSHFDKFKKILDGLFKPFQDSWRNEGVNTIAAAKYAFNELMELAKSVGKSIYEVWTNGTGTELLDSLQRNLQNILLLIGDVAKSFREAWNDEGRGTQIIQNIGDGLVNLSHMFESIGVSLRVVWAQVGDEIAVNCLTIFENVTHLFSEIPKIFKEAWDKNQIGTEFLTHIGEGFNNLLGLISQVTGALDGLWAKFGPAITDTVMQCLNATAGLFESMTIGFRGVWDNGGQHLFESIGRLATRIFELAGRIYSEFIAPITGSLAEILGPALGKILDLVAGVLDKFSELIEWLLKDGNPAFEILGAIIMGVCGAMMAYRLKILAVEVATKLLSKTTTIATTVSGLFSKALAFICTPAGAITLAIGGIIAIGVLLYKHWDEIGPRLGKIWESVKKFFGDIKNRAVEFVKNFIKGLLDFFSNLVNYMGDGIGKVLMVVTNFLARFLRAGLDLVINIAKGIGNGMGNAVRAMVNVGTSIMNAIRNINLFDIGRNLLIGLWNGISSVTDWILGKLGSFCDNVVDTVCDWFGIHSPSRVFRDQIGKMIPRGMAIGIETETDKVMKAMDGLMSIPTLEQPEIAMTSDIKPKYPDFDKDEVIKEILEIIEKDNPSDSNTPVIIELDGEVIAKSTVKNINRMSRRNGKPVIIV